MSLASPAGTAQLIDGVAVAKAVREDLAGEVAALKARGVTPGLTVVLVGDVATRPAVCIPSHANLSECITLMRMVGVRRMPVPPIMLTSSISTDLSTPNATVGSM